MGDIHYLPAGRERAARLLESAVRDAIADHPDPRVAARWARMARRTISRWPGPPTPSMAVIDLDTDATLDVADRARLIDACEHWIESYFGEVRDQMLAMHHELLSLQRQVAELEVAREDAER